MNASKRLLMLLCSLCVIPLFSSNITILPDLSMGGRFGDNLLEVMHVLWIHYKYGQKFLLKPFWYSDQLVAAKYMIDQAKDYKPYHLRAQEVPLFLNGLENGMLSKIFKKHSYFVLPYFPESYEDRQLDVHKQWANIPIEWNNHGFKVLLRRIIAPLNPTLKRSPSRDTFQIALHIREGGSFDSVHTKKVLPLKFPSIEYYIKSLRWLLSHMKDNAAYFSSFSKMRVILFTDHRDPAALKKKFKEAFTDIPEVEFQAHEGKHDWHYKVLDDYFSMVACNALIRAQSNFSITAAKLADYYMEIEPLQKIEPDIYTIRCHERGKAALDLTLQ